LKDQWLIETLYWFFRYVQWLFIVPAVLGLVYGYFKPVSSVSRQRKRLVYVLVAILLGPGLIVHTLFKDQWGRARPRNLIEFGGDKIHTPAFVISDQCERNCSFVSGHAAIAFFFVVFGFVGRKRWLWPGLAIGVAGAIGRVIQGGHFFSDVMFAGFFVYFTCWLLAKWMTITPALD
jgi:lipid A 4'-phosphatase